MNADQLIRAIASGDRAAFASLYRARYQTYVGYAAALLAGDRASAEDAVDEAFVDVWRSAASYTGTGHSAGLGEGWLRRIVRNKAIDLLRKRREVLSEDPWQVSGAASAASAEPSPFDLVSAQGDSAALRTALAKLAPEQREAVWLCYFEELPLREIAAIAGCPENTVKTRLFHARQKLRVSMAA